jgi:hypothetical protein
LSVLFLLEGARSVARTPDALAEPLSAKVINWVLDTVIGDIAKARMDSMRDAKERWGFEPKTEPSLQGVIQ